MASHHRFGGLEFANGALTLLLELLDLLDELVDPGSENLAVIAGLIELDFDCGERFSGTLGILFSGEPGCGGLLESVLQFGH